MRTDSQSDCEEDEDEKGSQLHGQMVAKKEMGHEWLLIMRWSAGAHIIGALNGGVREVRYWLHSREMHDLAV